MASVVRSLKTQVCYLMLWQLLVIAVMALLMLLITGEKGGLSAFLGGLCYWLPTWILATKLFAKTEVQAAKRFVMLFFVGEMVKLFLSAVLFVVIIKYLPVSGLLMMVGFVVAIFAFWIICGFGIGRMNGTVKE